MENILLHPMYFGCIAQYVAKAKAGTVFFENEDNYQKQTYRNRTYIYGANGKLSLSIPIKHTGNKEGRQLYKDVKIENDFPWQPQHWKSMEAAYRTSPFFEFYEDELVHLFESKQEFLLDFNYQCMEAIENCLQMDVSFVKTMEFIREPNDMKDLRFLVEAKKEKAYNLETYHQVFADKYGFISNLSILDLLFNEGTNALSYLEAQNIF